MDHDCKQDDGCDRRLIVFLSSPAALFASAQAQPSRTDTHYQPLITKWWQCKETCPCQIPDEFDWFQMLALLLLVCTVDHWVTPRTAFFTWYLKRNVKTKLGNHSPLKQRGHVRPSASDWSAWTYFLTVFCVALEGRGGSEILIIVPFLRRAPQYAESPRLI